MTVENESVCKHWIRNHYSVGWCGSECHSVQLGGGAIVKAPLILGMKWGSGRTPPWFQTVVHV